MVRSPGRTVRFEPTAAGWRTVARELIQGRVNGQTIARETRRLLEPANYATVVEELAAVRSKLGDAGAARRAAEAIMATIRETLKR